VATVEFTLTTSFVLIASVKSTLTATTVPIGTKLSVADNAGGLIPYDVIINPEQQIALTADKTYYAKSEPAGIKIRIEDDTP